MPNNLRKIFESFDAGGTFLKAELLGTGHIHETYLITTAEKEKDDYVLQKLNNNVFHNIPELQKNIERVTTHITQKLSAIPGSDLKRESLLLVKSKDGKSWIIDDIPCYWRLLVYIAGSHSYEKADTYEKAVEGGKAIGRFQSLLSDLPGEPLFETIPSFHDTEKRIENLKAVLKKDPAGRVKEVTRETDFLLTRSDNMKIMQKLGRERKIPLRITHNDTKFNNILFDENDRPLCLIDLDTVMPGYYHSDFGDAIRTGANAAEEDEADLSKVRMDIDIFRGYAMGYLSETANMLNDTEKRYLAFAPLILTYEQAVRFLTDYLDGDRYYKIHRENHNLQRTRAQIKLLESMEEQYGAMQKIIEGLVSGYR